MSESALGAFMRQLQPQGFLGCLVGNWAAWMGLQADASPRLVPRTCGQW